MDVMKPELIWINGKCYRISHTNNSVIYDNSDFNSGHQNYRHEEDLEVCDDNSDDESVLVETTASGRLQTVLHVPQVYFGVIIGAKGETRKQIESETGTMINIPRNKTNCDIVITGTKRSDVMRARCRLLLKVAAARQKSRLTHFLSIPMNCKQIQNAFEQFKDDVCQNCDSADQRVDLSLFQDPLKLHLTLGMMVLADDAEVKEVDQMLQDFKKTSRNPVLLSGEPLEIRMRGVEYMNDDPAQVHILYGRVQMEDGSHHLQQLADDLFTLFSTRGFIVERREKVKLHVTLMNSSLREKRREPSSESRRNNQRETFDARYVLEKFQDFDFGLQRADSVRISKLSFTDPEGYYLSVGSMKIL